jgi:putative membrane protein
MDMNSGRARHSNANRSVALVAFAFMGALIPALPAHAESAGQTHVRPWSDANIAAIVLAANTVDIKNGELAFAKSKSQAVKAFARQMMTDHSSVNAKATALATRLKLVPEENQASLSLVAGADSTRDSMRKLSGAAFDRAYVKNEVAYHQAVLDLLDTALVPAAQNEELKDLLIAVRPAFMAHLEHAKAIRASLEK